jgi:hypothetical protein
MKHHNINIKRVLTSLAAGVTVFVLFSSYSTGYTGNCTGSDGSTPGCSAASGCHGAVTGTATSSDIGLLDAVTGFRVTSYIPGRTYNIVMYGNLSGTGLRKYGYQISATKATGTPGVHTGVFYNLPSGSAISAIGADSILGHTTPSMGGVAAGSTSYNVAVGWVAPTIGTGSIKLKGVINATNGNNVADTGDRYFLASNTINEGTLGFSEANERSLAAGINPNPFINELKVSVPVDGTYSIRIYNMAGALVFDGTAEHNQSLNTSSWPAGSYVAVVRNGKSSQTFTVQKLK